VGGWGGETDGRRVGGWGGWVPAGYKTTVSKTPHRHHYSGTPPTPPPTPPPPPARPLPPLLLLICPVHAQKLERGQSRANPQSKHSDSALNPKREGRTRNETSLASLPHAFTRAGLHTSSPSVFRYSHHHRPSYRASCWAPANAPRPATSTCF
jgi:hypothetical protein